jgi:hypothetical protein
VGAAVEGSCSWLDSERWRGAAPVDGRDAADVAEPLLLGDVDDGAADDPFDDGAFDAGGVRRRPAAASVFATGNRDALGATVLRCTGFIAAAGRCALLGRGATTGVGSGDGSTETTLSRPEETTLRSAAAFSCASTTATALRP